MRAFACFSLVASAFAAPSHDVMIQDANGKLTNLGKLSMSHTGAVPFVNFEPVAESAAQLPTSGCIGLAINDQFVCQTLYQHDPIDEFSALRIYASPNGDIAQVQLAKGTKGKISVEVPTPVLRPALKPLGNSPKQFTKNKDGTVKDMWKESKANAVTEEATEQTFLEKYWTYLLPVGFLTLMNLVGRAPN